MLHHLFASLSNVRHDGSPRPQQGTCAQKHARRACICHNMQSELEPCVNPRQIGKNPWSFNKTHIRDKIAPDKSIFKCLFAFLYVIVYVPFSCVLMCTSLQTVVRNFKGLFRLNKRRKQPQKRPGMNSQVKKVQISKCLAHLQQKCK